MINFARNSSDGGDDGEKTPDQPIDDPVVASEVEQEMTVDIVQVLRKHGVTGEVMNRRDLLEDIKKAISHSAAVVVGARILQGETEKK